MNIANKLTISRILLVPFIMLFMLPMPFAGAAKWNSFVTGLGGSIVALFLFLIASITDFLDGHYARKLGLVSNFGKFLDPIADKLLVIATYACLVALDRAGVVTLVIIISREFLVTGMRLMAAQQGVVIAASMFGKAKMVTQLAAIIYLMSLPIVYKIADFIYPNVILEAFSTILVWIAVIMTVLSGADYLWKNRKFFAD